MRTSWRLLALLLFVLTAGCVSSGPDNARSPEDSLNVATSPTATTSVDVAATRPGAAVCSPIAPLALKSNRPTVTQYKAALEVAPPELTDALQRLAEVAEQLDRESADKRSQTTIFKNLGPDSTAQAVRDSYAVRDWYRHNCGKATAASAWCDAFSKATLDRDLAFMALNGSSTSTDALEAVDHQSLELFRSIRGTAPSDIAPKVQLLIDQYENNDGRKPADDALRHDADDALDAIIRSVRDQCGITISRLEL